MSESKTQNMAVEPDVSTEYRLLAIYHENRKSRSRSKPKNRSVHQGFSLKKQEPSYFARARIPASAPTDAFAQVADKLSHIVDSAPPAQDQVATDSEELDGIQRLVEVLIQCGDQMNDMIKKDDQLLTILQGFSYRMFVELASAFTRSMVPLGKQRENNNDQKIKIAWTFEMTSRLSALDLQPMNRAMGYGAQYVQQHFSQWIQQHGGWENAFKNDDGDEVQ